MSSKVSLQMVRERIHPEDIPLFDEVINRATNGDGFDYEYRLLLPSGAVKQVHVVAHAVRGEFGMPEFVRARVKEESIDLREARQTIQRIIRDGNRAGEILGRIRALFKKAEPAKEPLDLNEAIREILLLALGHRVGFVEHGKSVRRISCHQTGRPRHGAFDQPVDCGESPRATMGDRPRWTRSQLSLHPSDCLSRAERD